MAVVLKAFTDQPSTSYTLPLDGRDYRVTLRWSERRLSWQFDLETDAGDAIITGRTLCVNEDPTAGVVGPLAPRGRFVVLGIEPYRRDDLGRSLLLIYIPEAEIVTPERPVRYLVT